MDFDRLCVNHTPMTTRCLPLADRDGRDVLAVVAKLTCLTLADGAMVLAPRQRSVRVNDQRTSYYEWGSVQLPSDAAEEKPGTDVLMVGTLRPPPGFKETAVDVSLRAGPLHKTLRVHGPRVWYSSPLGVIPGPAASLVTTALTWENSFGGVDRSEPGRPRYEWRNPAGKGMARDRQALVGQPAPVLEDPAAPGEPAAFAPVAPAWEPRRSFAGTYDAEWQRTRAPVRPKDFDPRFHSCAPAGLWSATPFAGGETIEVTGAGEPWRARLPEETLSFQAIIDDRPRAFATHLDTVLIDLDAREIELTWRACVPLPRKWARLRSIVLQLAEPPSHGPTRLPTVR